jgi:uncharacterized protein
VYRTASGVTYLITRSGLLLDTADDSVHSIAVASPGMLSVGPSFGQFSPPAGAITFPGWRPGDQPPAQLTLTLTGSATVLASRLATAAIDVRIPSGDAVLAATVTRPAGSQRLPAIVIVHGSGRETRAVLDLWTQLYVSLGFAVLAYDKRGVGESTGTFPGEQATTGTLRLLAADVVAVARYLRTRPDVDSNKIALYGGSQGGWVVPLADDQAHPAFDIIASGPPVTVGQQGLFASFSGGGSFLPTESEASIDAQVAANRDGYDPAPILATDTVPTLWLFGAADRQVPTRVAVANLTGLKRPNFTWQVLAGCSHNLLNTGNGLDTSDAAATTFGAGLFARIAEFTRHQI